MNKEHIMNYKTLLYAINLLLSMVALSGVNFDKFMKRNKPVEARMLVIIFGIATSYLVTNFITDFMS